VGSLPGHRAVQVGCHFSKSQQEERSGSFGKEKLGMHKIVSEAQMSQPAFWFWYKKIVMPKKKLFVPRNLKDCLPNLPLKRGKQKRNAMRSLSFFYRDNFVLAWKMGFQFNLLFTTGSR